MLDEPRVRCAGFCKMPMPVRPMKKATVESTAGLKQSKV